jgi:hypothetical protein
MGMSYLANLDGVLDGEREVVALVDTASFGKATAVDPERNRELFVFTKSCWADDVHIQAVLRNLEESIWSVRAQRIVLSGVIRTS